jgi:hypothetical protein
MQADEGSENKLREQRDLCKGRYERLLRRNALEMEGYRAEAAALRKRLQQLDRTEKQQLGSLRR